jgi:Fe-S cluster assembly protein SufD
LVNTIEKHKIDDLLIDLSNKYSDKFLNSKWPTPVNEEWRRTNLSKYDLSAFKLVSPEEVLKTYNLPEMSQSDYSIHIRKAAGLKAEILINDQDAAGIVIFDPLQTAEINPGTHNDIMESIKFAGEHAENRTEFLSLSSFKDSIFIIVPDNYSLIKPILVEFFADEELFLPNLFVSTGMDVELKIIQKIVSKMDSNISSIVNINCGKNSNIQSATVNDISDGTKIFLNRYFQLSEKVFLSDFQSNTGGEFIKSKSEVYLAGEKADARLYGINFADKNNHIDLRTVQYHMEKDCFSQAEIKSVVRSKGRCIYQGLIEVDEKAPLTDAYLTNNNIVLNNGARADSIPSLKIRNNNVKCSHGSTTGKINEDQILYLTSRGIDNDEARQMILEGFLGSVYDRLSPDISSYCSPLIMENLKLNEDSN